VGRNYIGFPRQKIKNTIRAATGINKEKLGNFLLFVEQGIVFFFLISKILHLWRYPVLVTNSHLEYVCIVDELNICYRGQ
jgi:hypothetical protein